MARRVTTSRADQERYTREVSRRGKTGTSTAAGREKRAKAAREQRVRANIALSKRLMKGVQDKVGIDIKSPFEKTFGPAPDIADIVYGFAGGTLRSEAARGKTELYDVATTARQSRTLRKLEKRQQRDSRERITPSASPTLLLGPKGQVGRPIKKAAPPVDETQLKLTQLRRKIKARSRLRGLK